MNADIHALAGAYALDALSEDEAELFADHLARCSHCQAEVVGLQATAARLGASVSAVPPADWERRVLTEIRRTRQQPPTTDLRVTSAAKTWRFRTMLATAAALIVIVAAGITVGFQQTRVNDAEREQIAVGAVLSADDVEVQHAATDSGGQMTLAVSAAEDAAVVVLEGVPNAPRDHVYQMWLLSDDGDPRSVGTMDSPPPGVSAVVDDIGVADGFAITVEPDGGSQTPNGPQVVNVSL